MEFNGIKNTFLGKKFSQKNKLNFCFNVKNKLFFIFEII